MAKLPTVKQNEPTEAPRTGSDIARDVGRAVLQGATLGFSDEIYGAYKAFTSDKSFEEARKEIIEGLEAYRDRDPVAAYGFEILGGLFTGGAGAYGVARTGMTLGKAAGLGAAEGAIGGAATGETMGERVVGAAIGAPLGAGLGAAAEKIMPVASAGAKSMLERGYPLTMGQYYGDPLSSVEQKVSLPFIQESISAARRKPQQMFMNEAMNDALAPLGVKADPSLSGNELIDFAETKISDAYEDVVPKAQMNTAKVDQSIDDVAEQYLKVGSFDDKDVARFKKEIANSFVKYKRGGALLGENLKKSESKISKRIYSLGQQGDDIMADALREIQEIFRDEVALQNKNLPDLQAVNQAFRKTRDIVKLSEKRVSTGGEVTPSMLARERTKTLGRFSPEAMKAREAAQILGATVSDSGTAGREALSQFIRSPIKGALGLGAQALATGLYEFPSVGRSAAKLPSGLLYTSAAELARTPARMVTDTPRMDITLDDLSEDRQRSLLGQ